MTLRWTWILLGVAMAGVAGCDNPQAQFSTSSRTAELDRNARRPVEEQVLDKFGEPTKLVAWERLPVDYQLTTGKVRSVEGTGNVYRMTVDFDTPPTGEIKRSGLLWTSGDYVGQSVSVTAYDAAKQEIALDAKLEAKPGDEFTIGGSVLARGERIFAENCVHCHGMAGDGNGPTAQYLFPRPRDFRLGVFKFTSTDAVNRVNKDDLARTIKNGIPGTYMPSFLLLKDAEVADLVEYIRWLSMRGEFERKIGDALYSDYSRTAIRDRQKNGESGDAIAQELEAFLQNDFPGVVNDTADALVDVWTAAEDPASVLVPKVARTPDSPESRQRGRELFASNKAKCSDCHGPVGRGDGPQNDIVEKDPATNDFYPDYPKPGLHDDWGNPLKPRDLTSGIYRGGRRPVDVYRRIRAGIKGAKMPAFGDSVLTDEEVWDIVNYVMSIPFEGRSPRPVEGEIPSVAGKPETGQTATASRNP